MPSVITGLLLVAFMAADITAIPAFARKYETSCVTCHTGYPKLNAFGEAYRLNGYQYPEDDADQTKDEPTSLGSDAYKRVFPNAVWPSHIPGKPPLAIRVSTGFNYDKNEEIKSSFESPSLNLMAAGTMGENIGFYAGAHLFEEGEIGSIDRAFIQISSLFSEKLGDYALNLRIGQFIPNVVPFANHRSLSLTPYAFNTYAATSEGFVVGHAHGNEAFGIETFQLGAELSGVIKHRFRWGTGLVNGSGPGEETNSAKDGYFRAAYKFGGMGFDGYGGAADESGRNWVDNSVTLGGFAYIGSSDNDGTSGPNDLKRERFGADLNIWYANTNLFGGWITGLDEVMEGTSLTEMKYDLVFVEANQIIYPWLIGLARYERADPENGADLSQVVGGFTALYRANIKLVVETVVDPDDADFSHLNVKLDFAM
jgi:hypothetical protein